jgi:transposase, IS5 family
MIKRIGKAEDGWMWRKESRQRSFAEQSIVGGNGRNERLERIAELIDWRALERELAAVYATGEGRPAYRPLVMFKAPLLAQWYQLSDPGLEEALYDRLSFRRFVGLLGRGGAGPLDAQPGADATGGARSGERLFAALNRQLEERGLVLKRGTLLDATVVAAAVKPPAGPKGSVAPGQGAPQDPDAEWSTHKDGVKRDYHFGTKRTLGVDLGSGLVRKAVLTGAKTNESRVADQLIGGDEACVYADKAYHSAARRQLLARLAIADGIMRRAWWGTARQPDPQLVARNRALAGVRFAVERSFATMKRWYGYRRVRYRGLVRNALQLYLLAVRSTCGARSRWAQAERTAWVGMCANCACRALTTCDRLASPPA